MTRPETVEANKESMRRFVDEALNRGRLDVVDQTCGQFAEQMKTMILVWRTAFPDFHTTIENLVAENDWVGSRLLHRGTHQGEFLGLAATGKRVEFRSMIFNRYRGGIVVENWGLHDHARVREQLREDRTANQ